MIGIYNLHKETHTACLLVECFHCRRAALTVSAKLCLHHPQTILQPHTSSPQKAWITNNNRSLLFVYNQSPLPKKMYSSKVVGALLQAIWGSLDSFREKKTIHPGHHTYLGCMKPVDAICDLGVHRFWWSPLVLCPGKHIGNWWMSIYTK